MTRLIGFAAALSILLFVTGCQTTGSTQEAAAAADLVPLTNDEVVALVTGRTQIWPDNNGRGYFREDGAFEAHWKGDPAKGTWWVEDGIFCYDVEGWGGEWCYETYHDGDTVVNLRLGQEGKPRLVNFVDGNQL